MIINDNKKKFNSFIDIILNYYKNKTLTVRYNSSQVKNWDLDDSRTKFRKGVEDAIVLFVNSIIQDKEVMNTTSLMIQNQTNKFLGTVEKSIAKSLGLIPFFNDMYPPQKKQKQ